MKMVLTLDILLRHRAVPALLRPRTDDCKIAKYAAATHETLKYLVSVAQLVFTPSK